jgi:hypothetical protein
VKAIRRFYESKGLSVRDFAYYAIDEPCSEKSAEDVVNFGKLLQAADPEQQIFVTVYNAVTIEALKMMAPYVNLWVPSLGLNEEQRAIVEKTHPEWRRLSYSVIGRMRPLALRLLVASGQLDAAAVQAAASSALPFCLTANAGPLGRNLRTHGSYSYNATPLPDHYGERSGVKEGPVYFQGADAPTGPQAQNKADGDLTDGLTAYPVDYSINWWPPATWTLTFDPLKPYRLSHLHVLGDQRPLQALVSVTGADGSWQAVSQADAPRLSEQLAADGTTYLGLGNQTARYVRLEIGTGGEAVRLGEVRLWGWPVGE